jgi:MurNAc alpha-1-phosphate uridylyltransferase
MNTALILSAGRGERLRPLTNQIPKALCEVQGESLLKRHVTRLAKAGITRVVINHAYLGDQIKRHLGNGELFNIEIIYTPEPPGGLETAGGIINALPYFNNKPFITVNADIFTDFPFENLYRTMTHGVHLILVPKRDDHRGDFGLSDTSMVTNEPPSYVFPGIACYDPALFKEKRLLRHSITPWLRQWVDESNVSGELYHGRWVDIGTPTRLKQANTIAR